MKTTAHTLHICQILARLETKRTSLQDRFQATAEVVLSTLTLHKAQAGPQNNETGFAITELKEETNLTFECFGFGWGFFLASKLLPVLPIFSAHVYQ